MALGAVYLKYPKAPNWIWSPAWWRRPARWLPLGRSHRPSRGALPPRPPTRSSLGPGRRLARQELIVPFRTAEARPPFGFGEVCGQDAPRGLRTHPAGGGGGPRRREGPAAKSKLRAGAWAARVSAGGIGAAGATERAPRSSDRAVRPPVHAAARSLVGARPSPRLGPPPARRGRALTLNPRRLDTAIRHTTAPFVYSSPAVLPSEEEGLPPPLKQPALDLDRLDTSSRAHPGKRRHLLLPRRGRRGPAASEFRACRRARPLPDDGSEGPLARPP